MSAQLTPTVEAALAALPAGIADRSGAIFYSGQGAFTGNQPLYILGLNPGGSPLKQADNTVARQLEGWRDLPDRWSAYVDEEWEGRPAGTFGMQPRLRHMAAALQLDLRTTPSSNVIFVRSTVGSVLTDKALLLEQCWPVHAAVIDDLNVRTVLCLGETAGKWVRAALGAGRLIDTFTENNGRRWTSVAHIAPDGRAVATLSHPGRARWQSVNADPTPLVRRLLNR